MIELSIGKFIAFGFLCWALGVIMALGTIANIELKRISKNLENTANNMKDVTDKTKPKEEGKR